MNYRQHSSNEIGASSNVIKKIKSKRYFNPDDKELIVFLVDRYDDRLGETKKKKIEKYLLVVNNNISKFKRLKICCRKEIPMSFKKKIFLIMKG